MTFMRMSGISSKYCVNKTHRISVKADGAVPEELLRDLLDKAYGLVLSGFSKKKQAEILA